MITVSSQSVFLNRRSHVTVLIMVEFAPMLTARRFVDRGIVATICFVLLVTGCPRDKQANKGSNNLGTPADRINANDPFAQIERPADLFKLLYDLDETRLRERLQGSWVRRSQAQRVQFRGWVVDGSQMTSLVHEIDGTRSERLGVLEIIAPCKVGLREVTPDEDILTSYHTIATDGRQLYMGGHSGVGSGDAIVICLEYHSGYFAYRSGQCAYFETTSGASSRLTRYPAKCRHEVVRGTTEVFVAASPHYTGAELALEFRGSALVEKSTLAAERVKNRNAVAKRLAQAITRNKTWPQVTQFGSYAPDLVPSELNGAWTFKGSPGVQTWNVRGNDVKVFSASLNTSAKAKLVVVAPCKLAIRVAGGHTFYHTFAQSDDQLYSGMAFGGIDSGAKVIVCTNSHIFIVGANKCVKHKFPDWDAEEVSWCSQTKNEIVISPPGQVAMHLKRRGTVFLPASIGDKINRIRSPRYSTFAKAKKAAINSRAVRLQD